MFCANIKRRYVAYVITKVVANDGANTMDTSDFVVRPIYATLTLKHHFFGKIIVISAPGGHAVQRNGVDKLSCQILG